MNWPIAYSSWSTTLKRTDKVINMQLTNPMYNALKFVALVLLPGLSAAYFGLAQIWGLPNAEQVVGTATIIDTLLGLLLKASTTQYVNSGQADTDTTDGDLIINEVDGEKYTALGINKSLEAMQGKTQVVLKVVNQKETSTPAE